MWCPSHQRGNPGSQSMQDVSWTLSSPIASPTIALDVGCFSLFKEELFWEEAPPKKGAV